MYASTSASCHTPSAGQYSCTRQPTAPVPVLGGWEAACRQHDNKQSKSSLAVRPGEGLGTLHMVGTLWAITTTQAVAAASCTYKLRILLACRQPYRPQICASTVRCAQIECRGALAAHGLLPAQQAGLAPLTSGFGVSGKVLPSGPSCGSALSPSAPSCCIRLCRAGL